MLMSPSPDSGRDQAWLAAELEKRDQAYAATMDYWKSQQLKAEREKHQIVGAIEQLAQKLPSGD
jgi:hypothetical protein